MTNNSKHGGDREMALEAFNTWLNANYEKTSFYNSNDELFTLFYAGYEAALTQPPAVDALQWQPIETMPRNREVEVWSKYRQHMGVATFKDNEVVPDTLIYWREHVPPKALITGKDA